MTEDSNVAGVRMPGADPAKVAAEYFGECVLAPHLPRCLTHDSYSRMSAEDKHCEEFTDLADAIRAGMEQAWYEGEEAGLRRADYEYGAAGFQAVRANPYKAARGESE